LIFIISGVVKNNTLTKLIGQVRITLKSILLIMFFIYYLTPKW